MQKAAMTCVHSIMQNAFKNLARAFIWLDIQDDAQTCASTDQQMSDLGLKALHMDAVEIACGAEVRFQLTAAALAAETGTDRHHHRRR